MPDVITASCDYTRCDTFRRVTSISMQWFINGRFTRAGVKAVSTRETLTVHPKEMSGNARRERPLLAILVVGAVNKPAHGLVTRRG